MINVTSLIYDFRECARMLWNQHYRLKKSNDIFNLIDEYKVIRSLILQDYLNDVAATAEGLFVSIHADLNPNVILKEERKSNQYVTWQPLQYFDYQENHLFKFMDFFDFSEHNYIDIRYALISDTSSESGQINKFIVDVIYCDFWCKN